MPLVLYLATAVVVLALASRYVTSLSRAAAVVLLLLPLVFTGRALLTGRVYAPVELAYTTQPLWSLRDSLHVPEPQNRMLSDINFQMLPWREAARRVIAAHEWPLLNRFEGCGDVLAGEGQPAPFSPFTLLALLLPAAASFGFTASIAFLIAALGAFLLARALACSELASLVAAAVFAFGAPIALQILWPLGFAWALLPLVLTGTRRVVREPSIRSAAILMVALTLEALSGHPETLLHVVAIGAVFGLFELARVRARGAAIVWAIAAGFAALLLSAVALLPMIDAASQTVEHRIRTEFFAPAPLRVPAGLPRAALLADLLPFARTSLAAGGNYLMARAEAGSIALALAAFAIVTLRRRDRWFFVALGIVALLASANAPPVAQLLHKLPLFRLALNDRLASAVPLCIAILAAFAIDAMTERAGAVMVALLVTLAACGAAMRPGSIDAARFAGELAPLALAAIIVLLGRPRVALPLLLVLIVAQRTISDGALVPANDPRIAYPPLPLLTKLQQIREPFRIVATGPALFPNTATMYGLEDARVMTAMTLTPFDETFPLWCRRGGFGFNQVDDLTRPMLSMLNVRFALAPEGDPVPQGWRDVAVDRGMRLLENQRVLPRAFIPRLVRAGVANDIEDMAAATEFRDIAWLDVPGAPRDLENGPGTLSIRPRKLGFTIDTVMQRAGYVVISQTAWRGWRATIDETPAPVVRANHAFLAVQVPAGRHTLRVTYMPQSFAAGRAISFATLALLITGAALGRIRRHALDRSGDETVSRRQLRRS